MSNLAVTELSASGQVMIPEEVRKKLNLAAGAQFVVLDDGDAVILKTVSAPSLNKFEHLRNKARKSAQKSGLKQSDVAEAVKEARKEV